MQVLNPTSVTPTPFVPILKALTCADVGKALMGMDETVQVNTENTSVHSLLMLLFCRYFYFSDC